MRSAVCVALVVFVAGVALFSEHAAFPFYDHPDEPGKVEQVIHRRKNFHHPMLLLTSASLARGALLHGEAQQDPQRVVELGRRVVALFAAASAALLALLAARALGVWAGVSAGVLLVTQPLLYELAHYFKEDPPLLFGIAACALAAWHYERTRSGAALALLGAAAGVAAAGKYVGAALVPGAALVAACIGGGAPRERWRRAGRVVAAALLVWLVLDARFLRYAVRAWQSLGDETHKVYAGKHGLVRSVPHAFYFSVQEAYGGWWVPALAVLWLAFAAGRPRLVSSAEWLLAGVAALFMVAFSCAPKTSARYYLPIAIALCFLAVAGVFRWAAFAGTRRPRWRGTASAVALLVCLAAAGRQWRDTQEIRQGFQRGDDRAELQRAVEALPISAIVVQDQAARLPEPARRVQDRARTALPQSILGAKQAPDLGTLAELRARGVTHLALCESAYEGYFARDRLGASSDAVRARRAFYETALSQGRVLRAWKRGRVVVLQPGLVLVDISGLALE